MVCRRSLVSGRVQGVFYRATCVRKAQSLGLKGHARNLADGRVEVLACGEQGAVDQFIAWLWEGSPASKVTGVETTPCEASEGQRLTGFSSA
jgi:acylphosphatase